MPVKVETKKAPRFLIPEPEVGKIAAPKRTFPQTPPRYMNREVVMDNQNVHMLVTKEPNSRYHNGHEAIRTVTSRLIPSYIEPPGGIWYGVPQVKPTYSQVQSYIKAYRDKGFDVGAIVTRRFVSMPAMLNSEGWGIIVTKRVSVPFQGMSYNPYTVKWFQTDRAETTWAEDLFIIHPVMEHDDLVSIIADQVSGEVND